MKYDIYSFENEYVAPQSYIFPFQIFLNSPDRLPSDQKLYSSSHKKINHEHLILFEIYISNNNISF